MLSKWSAKYSSRRNRAIADQIRVLSGRVGFIQREHKGGYVHYKANIPKCYNDLKLAIRNRLDIEEKIS